MSFPLKTTFFHISLASVVVTAIVLNSAGCTSRPTPRVRSGEPVGIQLQRVDPTLKQQRFLNLLSFEGDSDTVFINSGDGSREIPVRADEKVSHTGARSLQLLEPWRGVSVRTDVLLSGGQLASEWTLMGGYFYCEQPAEVRLAFIDPSNGGSERTAAVRLRPREWTPVFVDTANEKPTTRPLDVVSRLRIEFNAKSAVWCDDLQLRDNTSVSLAKSTGTESEWSLSLRGKRYFGTTQSGDAFEIPAAVLPSDRGWKLDQVNSVRAMFSDGRRMWTVYSNGRAYLDAKFSPVIAGIDSAGEQHAAPAQITLPEDVGRIVRNSAGDFDNDGYNESLGVYEIQARGSRLNFAISPRSAALDKPMIEISGLPPGRVLATLEGRLIDNVVRLETGRVLIELPGEIRRRVEVNVSTRAEQAGLVP